MNYFKTAGGVLILGAVIGLEALFSAGIWYMISVGMIPALGEIGADVLAGIVAPVIGIMALVLFVYSHRLKQIILEWEAENGNHYNEDHQVYYNKHSLTWMVTLMKWVVLIMDTSGISFRVLETHVPWFGQALLFLVFEMLAISPWYVGTLVHIVSHRPAFAIRRDVAYMREVIGAQNEMRDLRDSMKRRSMRPATAPRQEIAPAQRQQALPEPRQVVSPPPTTTVHVSSPSVAPQSPTQFVDFTVATPDLKNGNVASLNQNGNK